MNTYIDPIPYGNKKTKTKDSITYTSYQGDRIISPFDGEVVSSIEKCRNGISIKHNIENETIYSNFCNLDNISVTIGQKIYQGKSIGIFSSDDIEFTITDKNGNRKNISKYLNKELGDNKKTEKTKTSTSSYKSPSSDDLGVKAVKAVFDLPKNIFKFIDKKLTKEAEIDKQLTEEINRIKTLLK
jgi:hypothetical protein